MVLNKNRGLFMTFSRDFSFNFFSEPNHFSFFNAFDLKCINISNRLFQRQKLLKKPRKKFHELNITNRAFSYKITNMPGLIDSANCNLRNFAKRNFAEISLEK